VGRPLPYEHAIAKDPNIQQSADVASSRGRRLCRAGVQGPRRRRAALATLSALRTARAEPRCPDLDLSSPSGAAQRPVRDRLRARGRLRRGIARHPHGGRTHSVFACGAPRPQRAKSGEDFHRASRRRGADLRGHAPDTETLCAGAAARSPSRTRPASIEEVRERFGEEIARSSTASRS